MEDPPCVCGHDLFDHHVSWFPTGGRIVEECENEECEALPWDAESRCMHYRRYFLNKPRKEHNAK